MDKSKSKDTKRPRAVWAFDPCTRVKQSKKEYDRYSLKNELKSKRLAICDTCGLLESECLCDSDDEFIWNQ
jgi:hypothetical protein